MRRRDFAKLIAAVVLPQAAQIPVQQTATSRQRVIPREVIEQFKLRPTHEYGLFILGEDGQPYSIDDVVGVIFEMTMEHWRKPNQIRK